ncbi:MAG: response regulator [Patescibacteria group bacterium]
MKKVLIIEDEEVLRSLVKKKLTKKGYDVEEAEDGEVGMSKMKEFNPDLILLDIIMPNMGGFEVLEEMNEEENLSKIPVVIVSNSGQPVEINKAKELGVEDWIVKTEFDPKEVLEKVVDQIGEPENKK